MIMQAYYRSFTCINMKYFLVQVISLWCSMEGANTQDNAHYHGVEDNVRHRKQIIPIIKSNSEQYHGGYKFSYETGNGIHAQETGYIKHIGDEKHETLVQKGSITYHDDHGKPITLTYIADEHGFQPQGEHLPTPPPIPDAIQKVLNEQNHEAHDEVHEDQQEYQPQADEYQHRPQYNY